MNQLKKCAVNFFSTTTTYKCDHFTRNSARILFEIIKFVGYDYMYAFYQLIISLIYLISMQIEFKIFVTN